MTGVLTRGLYGHRTQGECHVTSEAETEALQLRTKGQLGLPQAGKDKGGT